MSLPLPAPTTRPQAEQQPTNPEQPAANPMQQLQHMSPEQFMSPEQYLGAVKQQYLMFCRFGGLYQFFEECLRGVRDMPLICLEPAIVRSLLGDVADTSLEVDYSAVMKAAADEEERKALRHSLYGPLNNFYGYRYLQSLRDFGLASRNAWSVLHPGEDFQAAPAEQTFEQIIAAIHQAAREFLVHWRPIEEFQRSVTDASMQLTAPGGIAVDLGQFFDESTREQVEQNIRDSTIAKSRQGIEPWVTKLAHLTMQAKNIADAHQGNQLS